jgi:hypothetical protein
VESMRDVVVISSPLVVLAYDRQQQHPEMDTRSSSAIAQGSICCRPGHIRFVLHTG